MSAIHQEQDERTIGSKRNMLGTNGPDPGKPSECEVEELRDSAPSNGAGNIHI